jgi:hypothetical protein
MTNGAAFMLGCAYTLHKGAHVRTDMLWERYSERKKGWIDLGSYLLLFYPTLITLMRISIDDAWYSFSIHELSEQTPWRPCCGRSAPRSRSLRCSSWCRACPSRSSAGYQIRYGREFEHREKLEV